MLRPPIVLADEPTGNLDTTNGAHVLELLLELNRTEGTTLVLVTHDATLAACADRRIVLRDGLIVSDEMNPDPERPVHQAAAGTTGGRIDGERVGMGFCGEDCSARDASLTRQISVCSSFSCYWRGRIDRGSRILSIVPFFATG